MEELITQSPAAEEAAEATLEAQAEALAQAQAQLESLQRSNYILSRGITGEEAEFLAFRAEKRMGEGTSFTQAVDQLLAEATPTPQAWAAPVGTGSALPAGNNETMNALIRSALTRRNHF